MRNPEYDLFGVLSPAVASLETKPANKRRGSLIGDASLKKIIAEVTSKGIYASEMPPGAEFDFSVYDFGKWGRNWFGRGQAKSTEVLRNDRRAAVGGTYYFKSRKSDKANSDFFALHAVDRGLTFYLPAKQVTSLTGIPVAARMFTQEKCEASWCAVYSMLTQQRRDEIIKGHELVMESLKQQRQIHERLMKLIDAVTRMLYPEHPIAGFEALRLSDEREKWDQICQSLFATISLH